MPSCVLVSVLVCVCVFVWVCVCVCACLLCACVCVCVGALVWSVYVHVCMYVYVCMNVYVCVRSLIALQIAIADRIGFALTTRSLNIQNQSTKRHRVLQAAISGLTQLISIRCRVVVVFSIA